MSFANLSSLYRSTSFRLISLFMLFFLVATLIIVQRIYQRMETFLENQANAFVADLMLDNKDFVEDFGITSFVQEIAEISALNTQSREIYVLFDTGCEVIAGAPERLPEDFVTSRICAELENAGEVRLFDLPRQRSQLEYPTGYDDSELEDDEAIALLEALPVGGFLLIVVVVPEIEETREFLTSNLVWTAMLLFVVGLAAALLLTLSVRRRLEEVNAMSENIRSGDLSRRIPLDGSGDEFDNLSQNLNAMLDRIERVVEGSKQVTNDIAHDLRTPLTRIHTRIDSLQSRQGMDGVNQEQLQQIKEDATVLLEMFDSLLRIAGIESGSANRLFTEIDCSEICLDAIELLEPLAQEKGIGIASRLPDSAPFSGDKNLIFQAVNNVIANAIKYSPRGSQVDVWLRIEQDSYILEVSDQGPGIPQDEMKKVFNRFYRLEKHRSAPGYGLGLSLVLAVTELHGGTVRLENLNTGLKFLIELPRQC